MEGSSAVVHMTHSAVNWVSECMLVWEWKYKRKTFDSADTDIEWSCGARWWLSYQFWQHRHWYSMVMWCQVVAELSVLTDIRWLVFFCWFVDWNHSSSTVLSCLNRHTLKMKWCHCLFPAISSVHLQHKLWPELVYNNNKHSISNNRN